MTRGHGRIVTREEAAKRLRYSSDEALIVLPEESDLARLTETQTTCMLCRNFNLEAGQQAMKEQRFQERMKYDECWGEYLFNDWSRYGLCDVFPSVLRDGDVAAVVSRWLLDRSLKDTPKGNEKVACPHFEDRRDRGDKLPVGAYAKRVATY